MKVLIVGGGIFGSIAADMLKEKGIEVLIFDALKENSGSKAAGCLIKPKWVNWLGSELKPCLDDLNRLYGLKEIPIDEDGKMSNIFHINPWDILAKDAIHREVLEIGDGFVKTAEHTYEGKVLVAAGVWSDKLLPIPRIKRMCGNSLIIKGTYPAGSRKYSHYNSAIWIPRENNETWFGDGTKVEWSKWYDKYLAGEEHHLNATIRRAKEYIPDCEIEVKQFGMRPYLGKVGYFENVYPNTWVSTGGAKNGCVLATFQSRLFLNELGLS